VFRVAGTLPATVAEAPQVLPAAGAYRVRFIGEIGETVGVMKVDKDGAIDWGVPRERWNIVQFIQAV
jgi:hypothetical protein